MKQIPLTQNQIATVDDKDYEIIILDKWFVHFERGRYYAWRNKNKRPMRMHHVVMGIPPKGYEIDHIDRNGLNNQRNNLRIVTRSENNLNAKKRKNSSSQYKGVQWNKNKQKWYAEFKYLGKRFCLGYFNKEQDAAKERDWFVINYYGRNTMLNFPNYNYDDYNASKFNRRKLTK